MRGGFELMQCEGMGHNSMCNSFHCDFLRRLIRSVMYIVCNEVEGVLAASRWGGGGGGGGGRFIRGYRGCLWTL